CDWVVLLGVFLKYVFLGACADERVCAAARLGQKETGLHKQVGLLAWFTLVYAEQILPLSTPAFPGCRS
ncbi:MAG: hypothetical protein LUF68_00775, partial [Clostridiales bacterium]|nr:hypothetical protein [Clostridiales bacterium]